MASKFALDRIHSFPIFNHSCYSTTKTDMSLMEINHHLHLEKKSFKGYFFGFLMIFLAITMGFFAAISGKALATIPPKKNIPVF